MIRSTAYCDECGRSKGDANHWFRFVAMPGRLFMLSPWEIPLSMASVTELGDSHQSVESDEQRYSAPENEHLGQIIRKIANKMTEGHLCSESCAIKAMAKAIGSTSEGQNG